MKSFKWLQFTDLHLNPQESFDKSIAKMEMLNYLNEKKFKCDYVFFTGDIANRGNYGATKEFVEQILKTVDVSYENVFWSAGNHDIRRGLKEREAIINEIRNAKDPSQAFGKAMSDGAKREILTRSGINDYIENYKELFPHGNGIHLSPANISDAHVFYGLDKLNLVVLNTCLTSCDDEDPGKLMIAENRLAQVFDNLADCDSKKPFFVIGHHGIDFFQEGEKKYLIQLFDIKGVDFYLCGHAHELGYKLFTDVERDIHQITCGGLSYDGYSVISFVYGEFYIENCSVHVTIHSYSDKGDKKWHEDYSQHQRLRKNNRFHIDRLFPHALKQLYWPAIIMAAFSILSLLPQILRGFMPISLGVTIFGLIFAFCYGLRVRLKIPISRGKG